MAVALSRVTPAVVQRLQVPVQVLLYAALFVFADYLVNWLHLPLPANLVGMLLMLTLILCRILPFRPPDGDGGFTSADLCEVIRSFPLLGR
jgi:holin-like protein